MSLSLTSGSIVICSEHRIRQSPLRTSSSRPLSLSSCSKQLCLHQFSHISRPIKVTARSVMKMSAETISSGVPNNTMKLLFVEMGVGYDQDEYDQIYSQNFASCIGHTPI
ncbi:unnamed protein product [Arabidopsis thaliana]|uniref:Uncharacterized protein n=1 Tax=Arabidopsis thaliana TaxID=3702 RepID=A0A654EF24_ARATH|nr:unnamed protein product [Arabidopsis thaliana]